MSFRKIFLFEKPKELTKREQETMIFLVKFHRESRKELLLKKLNTSDCKSKRLCDYIKSEEYFNEMDSTRYEFGKAQTGSRTVRDYEKDRILKIRSNYLEFESQNEEIIKIKKSPISVMKFSDSGNTYMSNQ